MRIDPDPDGEQRRRRRLKSKRRRGWRLPIAVLGLTLMPIVIFRFAAPPVSMFMIIAWADARLHDRPNFRVRYEWVDRSQQSSQLALAVIAAEDQRFAAHAGFDFKQIRAVMAESARATRGASTISQQVAKNLFLWPGRSWARKGLEAWLTFWIERCWSKQRILEIYLNLAQFGDGIYGAGAASRHFFGKAARDLSAHEASLLAAVLPNSKHWRVASPTLAARQRAERIEQQMSRLGGQRYWRDIGWSLVSSSRTD